MAQLIIDTDLCVGCELCVKICPGVFEMRQNKAWIIHPKILQVTEKLAVVKNPGDCESCDCVFVIDSCPVAAITLIKS